jgi:hypothetical protein
MLQHLRQQARRELLAEGRKHAITARLRQIPYLGPIRSVLAVALMQTPHRFRTQATTMGVQRIGLGNPYQRGLPLCGRPTAALQETGFYPGFEQGPQS